MPNLITIPQPCNENWENFTAAEKGRLCQVCAKTVIDFTNWQPNAIAIFLIENEGKDTCGRFTKSQLSEPIPTADEFAKQVSYFKMSWLKKCAAIFLFAFVLQSNSYAQTDSNRNNTVKHTKGRVTFDNNVDKPKRKKTTKKKKAITHKVECGKPIGNNSEIMGKMIPVPMEQHLMGDTVIMKK